MDELVLAEAREAEDLRVGHERARLGLGVLIARDDGLDSALLVLRQVLILTVDAWWWSRLR